METKVYKNEYGHFEVVIYDNINYEIYEMMTPGAIDGFISTK